MSKRANTLRGTSNIAKEDYLYHKRSAKFARQRNIDIGTIALEAVDENNDDIHYRFQNGNSLKQSVKRNLQAAKEHYAHHADEYFDLALMDAHLDGIKINVEQPLEIGQKVEVHKPDQQ